MKPQIVLEENPQHENEVAAMISFIPGVKEEEESENESDSDISSEGFDMMEDECLTLEEADEDDELLIVNNADSAKPKKGTEEEKKEGDENDDVEDDGEMASGEFIFVLDRSGSMRSCERLTLAKKALVLFIQSLPADSKFNIVSFGGRYESMFPNSVKYS